MPLPKSSGLADRVVRKTLADGTVREYRYPRKAERRLDSHGAGTLGALLTAYKGSLEWLKKAPVTRKTQTIYLKHLEELAHLKVADIKRRMLLSVRDGIAVGSGPGAATMFVRCCGSLFKWAVQREYIEHSPAIGMQAIQGGHWAAWTAEQAAEALQLLPEPICRAILLALYTGQRRGDLCRMQWSNYDGRVIRLVQQKTSTALTIPVHRTLKIALDQWKAEGTSQFILHTRWRGAWSPGSLTHRLAYEMAKNGLPHLSIHGLRKLAAANLAQAGCSMNEIAAITGHASLAMVQLYTASADQERLAEAAMARLTTATDNQKTTAAQLIDPVDQT